MQYTIGVSLNYDDHLECNIFVILYKISYKSNRIESNHLHRIQNVAKKWEDQACANTVLLRNIKPNKTRVVLALMKMSKPSFHSNHFDFTSLSKRCQGQVLRLPIKNVPRETRMNDKCRSSAIGQTRVRNRWRCGILSQRAETTYHQIES